MAHRCNGCGRDGRPPSSATLPWPAAVAVEHLRASLSSNASGWDRISAFKDAVEAVVKSCCVYGLGVYLASPSRTDERDDLLLKLLVRPSTAHWVDLLEVLSLVRSEASPGRDLHARFPQRAPSRRPSPLGLGRVRARA